MREITCAYANTRATSLMRVENNTRHLLMTLIVWVIGIEQMKEKNIKLNS